MVYRKEGLFLSIYLGFLCFMNSRTRKKTRQIKMHVEIYVMSETTPTTSMIFWWGPFHVHLFYESMVKVEEIAQFEEGRWKVVVGGRIWNSQTKRICKHFWLVGPEVSLDNFFLPYIWGIRVIKSLFSRFQGLTSHTGKPSNVWCTDAAFASVNPDRSRLTINN